MKQIAWLKYPLFVKWYITSKCNLRCSHCYLTSYKHQSNATEKFFSFIDHFSESGVREILMLGGEPLVRRDFKDIVERIVKRGMKPSVATNGTMLTESLADELIDRGLKNYQISLEGPTAESNDAIRGRGVFEKAIKAAKILKQRGALVALSVTINRSNTHSTADIIRIAEELRADVLRLNPFAPVGTGSKSIDQLKLQPEDFEKVKSEILSVRPQVGLKIDSAFLTWNNFCGNCAKTYGCGAGTTNLILNSDFTLSACDMLNEVDRTKVSVEKPEEIGEIWRNHSIFRKWRGLEPKATLPGVKSFDRVHQTPCHLLEQSYI